MTVRLKKNTKKTKNPKQQQHLKAKKKTKHSYHWQAQWLRRY